MLKFGGPKFWSRAAFCVKVLSLPRPSFGLRVQHLSNFSRKAECEYSLPLCVQKACYTGGYGVENHGKYRAENRGGYRERNTGYGGRSRSVYGEGDLPPVKYENLEPIKKDLYQENPSVSNRSESEIDSYLKENKVNLRGQKISRPIFKFEESSFPEPILKALSKFGKPSVIQAVSWPLALSGKDIISIAKTGSGKTLGFVLPAIKHILNQPARNSGDGPVALVVLPTRELCQQVAEVAKQFGDLVNLQVGCVYGGVPRLSQAGVLRKGVDLLVGTPGRLMDFLQNKDMNLHRCSFLVMDEADRMLDMGFEPQIRKIVGQIRPDRQTLMFSATWPREVQKMASDFQTDPVFLNVGSLKLSANQNIKQHVEVVEPRDKRKRLFELLRKITTEPDHKIIVFANRKSEIEELTGKIRQSGFSGLSIHGDKSQNERDFVLNQFRSGRAKILVATDVAARGLDVSDVKVVINYDYPKSTEDYVHRIGRTGRGEKSGTSYTLFTYEDGTHAADLVKLLEESKQDVPEDLVGLTASSGYRKSDYRY